MKKFFKSCAIIFALATITVSNTSCDPEDTDAFIDGFYTGYYGQTPPGWVAPQPDIDGETSESEVNNL